MDAPLLAAEEVRVTVGDATQLAGATFTTAGRRLLCVGNTAPLLSAISGLPIGSAAALVAGGKLTICGRDVARGEHRAILGSAPRSLATPPDWTVGAYLHWAARLAGVARKERAAKVGAALAAVGLPDKAHKVRTKRLGPLERRLLMLAHALVHDPAVVLLHEPLDGVPDDMAGVIMGALSRATRGRDVIASAATVLPDSAVEHFAREASDVAVIRGGRLVHHGAAAAMFTAAQHYEVVVSDNAEALRTALAAMGIELVGGPRHFSLTLDEGRSPRDVLAAAADVDAAVVACVPLLG